MIKDFLNNLFNDKKPQSKPKKKSDTEGGQKKKSKNISTSSSMTYWVIEGQKVPVEVHKEHRKNIRVSFGKDKLILRTSHLISYNDETNAIAQLKDAISQQISKKPELLSRFTQKYYKTGDIIQVGTQQYALNIVLEARKSHAGKLERNGVIYLRLSQADTEEGRQKAIPTLLSRIISQDQSPHFSKRVLELNQQFFKKAIKSIHFKYNHSNWGSCSSSGNLNFSSRLLFAPSDVQDYVIIHELAHLIELNHSDKFWKLVSNAMPQYAQKEKWLKENGHLCRF